MNIVHAKEIQKTQVVSLTEMRKEKGMFYCYPETIILKDRWGRAAKQFV